MKAKGFTLVEMLVALALSFLVFLALSSFTNLSLRSGQNLSERSDFFNLVSTLQGTLLNPKQCTANMRRVKLKSSTATVHPVPYTKEEYDSSRGAGKNVQIPFVLDSIGIFSGGDPTPTSVLLRSGKFGKLNEVEIRVEPQEFILNATPDPIRETVLALLRVSANTQSEMGAKTLKSDTPLTVNLVIENPGGAGSNTNLIHCCGVGSCP